MEDFYFNKRKRSISDETVFEHLILNDNNNLELLLEINKKIDLLLKKKEEKENENIINKIEKINSDINRILFEKDYIIENLKNEIKELNYVIKNLDNKKINDYFC